MYKFIPFSSNTDAIRLPEKFNYPFNYTPHPLAKMAVNELQEYLKEQTDFSHDFGIKNPNDETALGKMFGVLVVKNKNNELGYLTAFSGKLGDKTQHKYFVPPVYDVLDENGFFKKTEKEVEVINHQIKELEDNTSYINFKIAYKKTQDNHQNKLNKEKEHIKYRRKKRKTEGIKNNQLNINEEFYLREYEVYLKDKISHIKNEYESYQVQIDTLKKIRKEKSAWGQQQIFKEYQFLNSLNEKANLISIFKDSKQNIPAGAGDCCAPKLLQYAFSNQLTPIALAEFWWGKPLINSVRKHNYFYPACTGKCKPILKHMLQGLVVEENPLLTKLKTPKDIEIVFEDDALLIVNKPHELLSVSGKEIKDSVHSIIKKKYPKATGPLLVHRLDMSTSGILLIAKNKEVHKDLQSQFIKKTIQKRYIALLDGVLENKSGTITLPLRVDLDDRPKQLVCYQHGKRAETKWERIAVKNNQTRVYFYPITGRTHQLRVHAAHSKGLNKPIIGDDLYGKKDKRLYLHAEFIKFVHPISLEEVAFTITAPF